MAAVATQSNRQLPAGKKETGKFIMRFFELTGCLREIPPWPEMGGQHPDMVCWPLGHILVPLNDPEVNLAFSAFTASETASLSSI